MTPVVHIKIGKGLISAHLDLLRKRRSWIKTSTEEEIPEKDYEGFLREDLALVATPLQVISKLQVSPY